ncbi:flagellar assembly protein T N-terminal domain-containing protein [Lacimicrobium alkaliphilum]|uniref:flagellar assembly protein T N-terminal domain-containing protein n=1 Tax=Lacimicrobium alkaliphilum TaxID=1526571 RepID=UPI0015D5108E|nr:flagellar assembly protein T N-terminal domain-containing protein [Lacimicrobium alkaliphilum]
MNKLFVLIFIMLSSFQAQAIWFEASGQAVVHNGDKRHARKMATQEALKQALMFAGARVNSVQHLADGLLQDDRLEVRSGGEVNKVELINEDYQGDIVTVAIRADIFPQETQCRASDYQKSLVTTWFPIRNKQQASLGQLYNIGKDLPRQLHRAFSTASQHTSIHSVENFYVTPGNDLSRQATSLARKAGGQFVLLAEITDISDEQTSPSMLAFWKEPQISRNFSLDVHLINGMTGEVLISKPFRTRASWPFDPHKSVDTASNTFWQSSYGMAIRQQLDDVAQRIDDEIACLPAHGRVLQSTHQQLSIDIGKEHGVSLGDRLKVFKLNQFYDPMGNSHYQYQVHPVEVQVTRISLSSSVVESVNGVPLANIQPNDFVSRR